MTACPIPVLYIKERAKDFEIVHKGLRGWMLVPEFVWMCENLQEVLYFSMKNSTEAQLPEVNGLRSFQSPSRHFFLSKLYRKK